MTSSLEEYLKTIYILIKNNSNARVTDIANYLGYTKASVNRALKVLKNDSYIKYENYGDIELTKKGIDYSINIIRKHNTIKAFLTEVLEVDSSVAEKEAKTMKHSVSEDTINKLEKYIQSIIDIGDLECGYNPESVKCRKCVKVTAKNRLKKER